MTTQVLSFVPKAEDLSVTSERLRVEYLERQGAGPCIVYLHGLGSTKEDFSPVASSERLGHRRLISLDFPGCGQSSYPAARALTVDDLVVVLGLFLQRTACEMPVLVGHSMGGLVALLYAQAHVAEVSAFVNVEGNLAPEDCIFSRDASRAPAGYFRNGRYFAEFRARLQASGKAGFAQYADELCSHVGERAFRDYCVSVVKYSDETPLLESFERLPIPKLFIHGSENAALSYLPRLRNAEIPVISIPGSNHFPARSAPDAFVRALEAFVDTHVH